MSAKRIRVFISSKSDELSAERKLAYASLDQSGLFEPVWFEAEGANPSLPMDVCIGLVKSCKMYVGIFGDRFSEPTQREYWEANLRQMPCFLYIKNLNSERRDKRLKAFIEQLKGGHFLKPFVVSTELENIVEDLKNHLTEVLTPNGKSASAKNVDPFHKMAEMCSETLRSNLLPVISLPEHIYTSENGAPHHGEYISKKDNAIWSFHELPETLEPKECRLAELLEKDKIRWGKWIVELLNKNLVSFCRILGLTYYPPKHAFYYSSQDGREIKKPYLSLKGLNRKITVVRKTEDGFYRHSAVSILFTDIGGSIFLRVTPTFFFTKDGKIPLKPKLLGNFVKATKMKEHNLQYLHHLIFWSFVLSSSKNSINIPTGKQTIQIANSYLQIPTQFGILTDNKESSNRQKKEPLEEIGTTMETAETIL